MTPGDALAALKDGTVLLDVRPTLAAGGEPFGEIMQAVEGLRPGQGLAIRAPFKPSPLFGMLAARGFQGTSTELSADDWLVDFQPFSAGSGPARPTDAPLVPAVEAPAFSELDVRGLEPPEPLLRILAACNALALNATLKVLHERRPEMLYSRLDGLGLRHRTEELAEDVFHIYITKPGPHGV